MYIVLLFILIVLLLFSVLIFNKEILAPSVVMLLMFILAGMVGLIRWNDWELYNYSFLSTMLLLIGIFCFTISSSIVQDIYITRKGRLKCPPVRRNRIEINGIVIFLFILIGILTNILYYITIKKIVEKLGFSVTSLSVIINHFRNIVDSDFFEGKYTVSIIVKLIGWTITSIGIFSLFIFFHNLSFRVFKKRDYYLLVVAILWLTAMLLNSHRSYVLTALGESIYLLFFFENMYYGWKPSVSRKILNIGIKLFIFLIIIFIGMALLLGRFKSFSDMNIKDYTTVYISSGIRNFDLFIKEPINQREFGYETFASLYRSINNRFNLGYSVRTDLEFRYIGNLKISNVYTAFRRYYSDFGIFGIIIIPSILGAIFTSTYEKIKYRSKHGILDFNILLFLYFCKGLFQMCIEETILDFEISLNGLYKILVLYFLYFFLIKNKYKIKIKNVKTINVSYNKI